MKLGDSPDDRDADRVRHLAIQSMVLATSDNKLRRANRGKSRTAGKLSLICRLVIRWS